MSSTFHILQMILHEKFSFHYDQIQLEAKLELELGMDSRELLELFYEIEQRFKIRVNFDDIDSILADGTVLTLHDLVKYIEKKQASQKR